MGTGQQPNSGARVEHGTGPAGAPAMRAVVQHRYGPLPVLGLAEVGIPSPGRGEVLVQVGAASVHPGDYYVMTGEPYVVRLVFGLRRPRHGILGRDLAGVVSAVEGTSQRCVPATGCSAGAPRERSPSTPASLRTTSCPCPPTSRS